MDKSEVIEFIKAQLGHPTVSVYTEDVTIDANVEKAYRMFKSKILPEKTITIPFSGSSRIDMSQHHIAIILDVTPELQSSSGYSDSPNYNEFVQAPMQQYLSSSSSVQDLAFLRQRQGSLEYLLGSIDFDWQDPFLLVDNVSAGSPSLTVKAMVEPQDISEIDHENWIEDYALALTKIVEGRIRSKFSGGPMEFESDGQTLVDEGKQEKGDLEESLKNRAPLKGIRRG